MAHRESEGVSRRSGGANRPRLAGHVQPGDLPAFFLSILSALTMVLWGAGRIGVFHHAVLPATLLLVASMGAAAVFAWRARRESLVPLALFLAAIVAAAIVTAHPSASLEAGRDPGVYRQLAMWLEETGSFHLSTLDASTYHGYEVDGGTYVPNHATGYSTFLAWTIAVVGLDHLGAANALLLALTGAILACLAWVERRSLGLAIASIALLATSYLTVWFTKDTYAENLQLVLLVGLAYNLIRSRTSWIFHLLSLPLGVLLLATKAEGVLFLAAYGTVALLPTILRSPLRMFVTGGALLAGSAAMVLLQWRVGRRSVVPMANAVADWTNPAIFTYASAFPAMTMHAIWLVGLGGLIVLAFFLSVRGVEWSLVALFAPTLVYLAFPIISPDYPWFFRHLWPTLLPFGIALVALARLPQDRPRRVAVAAAITALVLSQGVASAGIYSIQENAGITQSWESMLADAEPGAVVLLPPGLIGVHAGTISLVTGVRLLQLPVSYDWAPRFPASDFLDAANLTTYVGDTDAPVYVVSYGEGWIDSPWSAFFVKPDTRLVSVTNFTFTKLRTACQIQSHASGAEARLRVDMDLVWASCSHLPREVDQRTHRLHLHRVEDASSARFFATNPGLRASEDWRFQDGGLTTARFGEIRLDQPRLLSGIAHEPGRMEWTFGRELAPGPFEACVEGRVRFFGNVTILGTEPVSGCAPP